MVAISQSLTFTIPFTVPARASTSGKQYFTGPGSCASLLEQRVAADVLEEQVALVLHDEENTLGWSASGITGEIHSDCGTTSGERAPIPRTLRRVGFFSSLGFLNCCSASSGCRAPRRSGPRWPYIVCLRMSHVCSSPAARGWREGAACS